MDTINKRAVSEVLEILNSSEKSIVEKIPESFINFLKENSEIGYEPKIDFSKDNWEETIQNDAKAILALIYRDYIVSPEERKLLIEEEANEKQREEEKLREKYNPDEIFKRNTKVVVPNNNIEEKSLIEIKEEKWYKKIIKKILSFFGKK